MLRKLSQHATALDGRKRYLRVGTVLCGSGAVVSTWCLLIGRPQGVSAVRQKLHISGGSSGHRTARFNADRP